MPNQTSINDFLANNPTKPKPDFILVPLLAQGHLIPMLDLARLLAASGASVTFISTPVNSARIRPSIDRIQRSTLLNIHFVDLHFPSAAAGLPAGCENVDLIPSPALFHPFIDCLRLLAPQLRRLLAARRPPDCLVFDSQNAWAAQVAKSLGIPQLIFYGPSCFYILCSMLLRKNQVLKTIVDDFELFPVPGLPVEVEVMKVQVARMMDKPGWERISEEFYAAEDSADGVVMNTFEDLERACLEKYSKERGKKVGR